MMQSRQIKPAFQDGGAPIVFESSGYFIPYLSIAIQMLRDCCSGNMNYDIIILEDNVSNLDKQRILQIVRGCEHLSVRFYNPYFLVEKHIKEAKNEYLTVNYYRMALPWILSEYDTAVNLGADILIRKELAPLCNLVFEKDKYMAGVADFGYIGRLYKDISPDELNLRKPLEYVNADVLVYNLKAIRERFTMDEMLEYWQKYCFRCAEQDALNKLFDEHKQLLDVQWNVFPERMTSTDDIMHAPESCISQWHKALKDPSLVHFAAVPKPWAYPIVGHGEEWWAVARQSIYYEEIVRRMCSIKLPKQRSFDEIVNLLLPKGTKRRAFFKHFKSPEKWGLLS